MSPCFFVSMSLCLYVSVPLCLSVSMHLCLYVCIYLFILCILFIYVSYLSMYPMYPMHPIYPMCPMYPTHPMYLWLSMYLCIYVITMYIATHPCHPLSFPATSPHFHRPGSLQSLPPRPVVVFFATASAGRWRGARPVRVVFVGFDHQHFATKSWLCNGIMYVAIVFCAICCTC